jgi:hypothetical protein
VVSSRITIPFGKLFASGGYVSYPLLTLTPLYLGYPFLARLACLSPAASVRSEPGSNSSKVFVLALHHYFIPKFKRIDLKRLVVMCPEGHTTVCFVSLYSYCVVNPSRVFRLKSDFHHHFATGPAWLGGRLCRSFTPRQAPTFRSLPCSFSQSPSPSNQLFSRLVCGGAGIMGTSPNCQYQACTM